MWKCICGNYNDTNYKCIKCGRRQYKDIIFKWHRSIEKSFGNVIEKSEYISDIFKFKMIREPNFTKISIMILPITFGKSSHRAVTIDVIEIERYLSDEDIRDKINCWIGDFRNRIENIQINGDGDI